MSVSEESVTMTVFLGTEGRHSLFPFRTEGEKGVRDLVIKISFGDINYFFSFSEQRSSKGIKAQR